MLLTWVMVLTLYNPAADRIGQYKIYPFPTEQACKDKIEAHTKTHATNSIPERYIRGDCLVYQVSWMK